MKAILKFKAPKSCDDYKFMHTQSTDIVLFSCYRRFLFICLSDENKHGDMSLEDVKVKRADFCPLRFEE